MTVRSQRALLIAIAFLLCAAAAALILSALSAQITFYKIPKEIAGDPALLGEQLRVGGFVEKGSVQKRGAETRFSITDFSKKITVIYHGILPDLFREGQGVIAEGVLLKQNLLRADIIFAKHDENYRPPNLPEKNP